jgi:hypothetical protein
MWVDRANMSNYVMPGGSSTTMIAWANKVSNALPGSAANPPTIAIDPATGIVTITIRWMPPNVTTAHNLVAVAQIQSP